MTREHASETSAPGRASRGGECRREAPRDVAKLEASVSLPPHVGELWSARLVPGQRHLVLPDGCMDLVFRTGGAPELFWVGPMTRAEVVEVAAPADYVAIRFRPGVAPAVAGIDARDVVDRDLAFGDPRLVDRLAAAPSDAARRALLVAAASRASAAPDPLVVRTAAEILRSGGAVQVTALARRAGVAERTLHRRFVAAVGYGPKRLCRIARLGVARELAARGLGGAALAAEAGYHDQAHLCHELARFGVTAASLAA